MADKILFRVIPEPLVWEVHYRGGILFFVFRDLTAYFVLRVDAAGETFLIESLLGPAPHHDGKVW